MADSEFSATQWWQTGVVYQIYPRSFQDTDGDGVGDLPGITARLDYLVSLGVNAIWISPFYTSPMADFGYDVSNYCDVDPLFGTIQDFETLLNTAHSKGLRVILDFVPNHTSDQHPWFVESRSSKTSAKRDWYLWRDPRPGDDSTPARERFPNNWTSQFGGSAWEWDQATGQFYLHSFLKEQPDLNWRNPEVRQAMYDAMRFWLDRGVDGFRMDVIWLLVKDAEFRDNPPNPDYHPGLQDNLRTIPVYNADQPETHVIVREMRALLDTYPDALNQEQAHAPESPMSLTHVSHRLLIGEIYLPLPELVRYYGGGQSVAAGAQPTSQLSGANLPFNFHLIQTAWNAEAIAKIIHEYEHLLPSGAWPNWVLGNHDQQRLVTRIGGQQARAAAMLLLTLRGTPTMYYGDELGMADVPVTPEQVQDPAEKNEPGKGRGRDPERSPMLWVDAPNAGFTRPDAKPWLPLSADWTTRNAACQREDAKSMLSLYARLLKIRGAEPALHSGAVCDVEADGPVLKYRRRDAEKNRCFQVLLNLSNDVAHTQAEKGRVVLTTLLDGEGAEVGGDVAIEGGEGLLILLD